MKRFLNIRSLVLAAVILPFLICVSIWVRAYQNSSDIERLASCFNISDGGTRQVDAQCLQSRVATLLESTSTASLIRYATYRGHSPLLRRECHSIAHAAGMVTFRKTRSIEESLRQCVDDCNSGCSHGAMAASIIDDSGRAGNEIGIHINMQKTANIVDIYCKNLNSCHTAGHAVFIATNDTSESLKECEGAASDVLRVSCYNGVFMENAGTENSISFLLASTTRTLGLFPLCTELLGKYQQSCFQFLPLTPAYILAKDGELSAAEIEQSKIVSLCKTLKPFSRSLCFEGLGGAYSNTRGLCRKFETLTDRNSCTLGTLRRVINFDRVPDRWFSYCSSINEKERRTFCFHALFQTIDHRSHDLSERRETYCRENTTSSTCEAELEEYLKVRELLPDYYFGYYGQRQLGTDF